jgi:nitrous oxide reductase accessory protein NosL
MKSLTLATLISSLLLAACGSMPNRASVASIPSEAFKAEKSGVVILSTGAPETCVSMATFLKVFEASSKKQVDSAPLIPVDAYTNKSEFATHHGLVNAIALPAGEYYVSPWTANPYVVATKTPSFGFKVQPGETVYVGELFMPRSCGLSTALAVRDQYDRDMKLATEKNPLVAQRAATKRLMLSVPQ